MKKKYIVLIVTSILILLTSILFLVSNFGSKYDIILSNELSDTYSDDLESHYKVKVTSFADYANYYDQTKAVEVDEFAAKSLLDTGLGIEFIPYYNTKAILVKVKDSLPDITSLNELKDSGLNVSFHNTFSVSCLIDYMSISYSLYEKYDLNKANEYLKALKKNGTLNSSKNLLDSDYIITTTLTLNELEGKYSKVLDISEGALECNIGLLVFDKSLDLSKYEEILTSKGFKQEEFENTFRCEDYLVYGKFAVNRVARFRRNVLGTYKFSGATSDERSIILILFIIFMIPWAIAIGTRINDKEIKKAVIVCLGMVLSWLVLRYLRGHFSNEIMQRYIWYLNYLPLIFAPILFLNANMVMTMPRSKKNKIITLILLIVSTILLFLVLTNDIFEFTFVFKRGLSEWSSYSYGFLFYVICLVGFVELIAGITLLIKKNYKQIRFYELLAPILIFIFIFAYIACDFVGISFVTEMDYTLIICLIALLLWEVTLRVGLVQNCGKYYSLFNNMSFDLALLSNDKKVIYETLDFGDMPNIDKELTIGNTRYREFEIHNGYTILKDNLEVLDSVKEELNKRKVLLEKNNRTLEQQHKIMSEYYSLQSQNEILDEIDKDYKNKNEEIIHLIEEIEPLKDKKDIYPYLARIKFLVSYTKQKYNLFLNSKLSDKIEIQTVALAIHIIMEDAKNLGLDAGLLCNSMELIDSNISTIILDIVYMMMENALKNNSDLFTNIDVNNEFITVFGLFKDNSNIELNYFSNSINSLIENKKIEYEIKQIDDMEKFIVRIRRDL